MSFKGFSGTGLFTALCSTTPVSLELVHKLLYLSYSNIKCPFHCTSPFCEWHSPSELIDYSWLNILVAFVKATSCWHLANNLHTLMSPYWLHYTPSAREDLWLHYTSRHISLPSILNKPCQWSASIAVQLIVFSGFIKNIPLKTIPSGTAPLLEASKHDILFGIKYSYYLVIAP